MSREACCGCGALSVRVDADPVRISICHCQACQRRTGSVFGAQARFPAEAVTISGESRQFVRHGDSGQAIRLHFCPQCGSTVYYTLDVAPGFIAVPVGAFADPTFPTPRVAVYDEHRHPWVVLPDGCVIED